MPRGRGARPPRPRRRGGRGSFRSLRPAIVFGPEDDFSTRSAAMARLLPVLPLIGGGATRFQPVYVGDVADAVAKLLEDPATRGRTYELGGPRVYSFKELLKLMLRGTRPGGGG